MANKLYRIELSHPSYTAKLMLEHKGIEFEDKVLLAGLHPALVRAAGFPAATVPAVVVDGTKVQGTRNISRTLDQLVPDPPLFGSTPSGRAAIEEAEQWGEQVFQPVPRRVIRWVIGEDRALRRWVVGLSPLPGAPVLAEAMGPIVWALKRKVGSTEPAVRADLAALPGMFDHIDAMIAAGTLNGEQLNAADFQIGTTMRMMLSWKPIDGWIAGRPSETLARRVLPDYPEGPVVIPADLLPR